MQYSTSPLGALVSALAVAAMMVVSTTASATSTVALSIDDLVDHADAIVVGRAIDRKTIKARGAGRSDIITVTEFRVDRWLKGSGPSSQVSVGEVGGERGGVKLTAVGVPVYHIGDEVVIFLRRAKAPAFDYQTLGLAQGSFHIRRGMLGTPSTVVRHLTGLHFPNFALDQTSERAKPVISMPLTTLLAQIKRRLAEVPAP